jgi:16S rRNA (guanine527-N7)-methyltransferase
MDNILQQIGEFDEEKLNKVSGFVELLLRWNKSINLIAPGTMGQVWERHVLDSAQLLKYIPEKTKLITDFGSGAGFPGIVLAILGGYELVLVESNNKKCSFLKEAARITQANVEVVEARIDNLEPWASDVVTARALAPLDKLLAMTTPFIAEQGQCLFLKGKEIEKELDLIKPLWEFDKKMYKSIIIPDDESNQGWVLELKNIRSK